MNYRLRNDEVATGATFVETNFVQDRPEMEVVFPEFDTDYLVNFQNQITVVKALDRKFAKTQQQKNASQKLYDSAENVNTLLNALSFQFNGVKLSTAAITKAKSKLHNLDIEAASEAIKDLASFTKDNLQLLATKGIKEEYPSFLEDRAEELLQLNKAQNALMDQGQKLSKQNEKSYNQLRKMVMHILKAGKIVFATEMRKDFYSKPKLIARMRSGNPDKEE